MLAVAVESVGLSDFGDEPGWEAGYRAVCSAMDEVAQLNVVGRLSARAEIIRYLQTRLRLVDLWRANPGIQKADIPAYLADKPKDKFGKHVYDPAALGLDESTIRTEFADYVDPEELEPAPLMSLGAIALLVNQQQQINQALAEAVAEARARGRTWSEIGALLGVTKQAAQQKYGTKTAAA